MKSGAAGNSSLIYAVSSPSDHSVDFTDEEDFIDDSTDVDFVNDELEKLQFVKLPIERLEQIARTGTITNAEDILYAEQLIERATQLEETPKKAGSTQLDSLAAFSNASEIFEGIDEIDDIDILRERLYRSKYWLLHKEGLTGCEAENSDDLESSYDMMVENNKTLQTCIRELLQSRVQLQTENKKLKADIHALNSEREGMKMDLYLLNKQIGEFEKEGGHAEAISRRQLILDGLTKEFDEAYRKVAVDFAGLQNSYCKAQEENELLQNELVSSKLSNAQQLERIDSLTRHFNMLEVPRVDADSNLGNNLEAKPHDKPKRKPSKMAAISSSLSSSLKATRHKLPKWKRGHSQSYSPPQTYKLGLNP